MADSGSQCCSLSEKDPLSPPTVNVVDLDPLTDKNNRAHKANDEDSSLNIDHGSTSGKECWGVQHTVVCLAWMGAILLNAMRYNMSIAIVSMAARPAHASSTTKNSTDICPLPEHTGNTSAYESIENGEFQWDEATQGLILGAFFCGNILTNVPGGRAAEHFGGKPVFLFGMALSSVFTLLSPVSAKLSTELFIAVRLLLGLAQGVVMPAVQRCLVTWIPPHKRSKFNTFVFSGEPVGIVVAMFLGGWLCDQIFLGGWPAAFYVFGGLGLVWSVAWALVVSDRPEDHTRISKEEKDYLLSHCQVKRGKATPVHWRNVMTSVPMWAIIIMHFGYNWGYYTFVTELPSYLSNIQHFDVKSNGALSALPYTIKWCFALLFAGLMDRASASGKLSILAVRRISMIFASYIPAVGLGVMCFVNCNQVASVVILCLAVGVTGSAYCGFFCSHQDISPNLAGTLYGITNTLANITGFLAPAVIGFITLENQTLTAWNTVFLLSAAIYTASCTVYVFFIAVQVQPFDNPKNRNRYGTQDV